MAGRANIQLLLPGQGSYGYDVFTGFYGGVILLKFYVAGCRSMASFAVYAIHDGIFIQGLAYRQGTRFYKLFIHIRSVAFETAAGDKPGVVGVPGGKTRAIDPGIQIRKISEGELKQLIVFPIGICLRFFPGAENDIGLFGSIFLAGYKIGLKKGIFIFFDADITGVRKIKTVVGYFFKELSTCCRGCFEMIAMRVGIGYVPVAIGACF